MRKEIVLTKKMLLSNYKGVNEAMERGMLDEFCPMVTTPIAYKECIAEDGNWFPSVWNMYHWLKDTLDKYKDVKDENEVLASYTIWVDNEVGKVLEYEDFIELFCDKIQEETHLTISPERAKKDFAIVRYIIEMGTDGGIPSLYDYYLIREGIKCVYDTKRNSYCYIIDDEGKYQWFRLQDGNCFWMDMLCDFHDFAKDIFYDMVDCYKIAYIDEDFAYEMIDWIEEKLSDKDLFSYPQDDKVYDKLFRDIRCHIEMSALEWED